MFLIEGMIPGSLTGSRNFALSLCFLFSQAVFQITFLSAVATLLQLHSDENNPGQDHVAIRINQSCLDPIGSFPFGITATAVGAPWTVAGCGALTVASLAYVVLFTHRYAGRNRSANMTDEFLGSNTDRNPRSWLRLISQS